MRGVSILGSTGSIGRQTLDVVRETRCVEVAALTAHEDAKTLFEQIVEFRPRLAALSDEQAALELKFNLLAKGIRTEILSGFDGMAEAAGHQDADIVLNAISGAAGLLPSLSAIEAGKTLALANKETLVAAGEIIMREAQKRRVRIIPVDSEHSAIFQCLQDGRHAVEKILLTASGGAFRGKTLREMARVTPEQALNHPNWNMGKKVTVDSSTMMNKGLEIIEAKWLFDCPAEKIEVVVHPQSIVHSAVQFEDGAVLAQLGMPDMRLPIQYALTYPSRAPNGFKRLDLAGLTNGLTFERPDYENFPCLGIAVEALKEGGCYPAVMNAANEMAVERFLNGSIGFTQIADLIKITMSAYNGKGQAAPSVKDVIRVDQWARQYSSGVAFV